jgi:hypothetical protein
MSTPNASPFLRALERLAPFPAIQTSFRAICEPLVAQETLSVLLSGSIAAGSLDELSDIDLEVIVHDPARVASVRAEIDKSVRALGPLLAHFPATHLGLPDLLIYFLQKNGSVVKVDAWTADLSVVARLGDAQILHDPGGAVARSAPA